MIAISTTLQCWSSSYPQPVSPRELCEGSLPRTPDVDNFSCVNRKTNATECIRMYANWERRSYPQPVSMREACGRSLPQTSVVDNFPCVDIKANATDCIRVTENFECRLMENVWLATFIKTDEPITNCPRFRAHYSRPTGSFRCALKRDKSNNI